ncbi:MAG: hypothetical protein ACLFVB_07850 [Thermoplasmata archaeon]
MDDEKELEKKEDEYGTLSQSSLEQSSADKSLEQSSADKDEEKDEKDGLRFAPWIGTGFGLIVSGYLARYFLQMFTGMRINISPSIGNIFIILGIIVLLVALTAEIFTAFKEEN